jgi:rubrerythrin
MKLIKRILKDERIAPKDYSKLLKQVSNSNDKKVIRKIIKDERRHFRLIKSIGGKNA